MESLSYDKKEEYKNDIEPLVRELMLRLREHKIPFFFTVALANDEEKTEYENEVYTPLEADLELAENRIMKHLNVCLGFNTVPFQKVIDWDFEGVPDDSR